MNCTAPRSDNAPQVEGQCKWHALYSQDAHAVEVQSDLLTALPLF